jgi:hypothetical protein
VLQRIGRRARREIVTWGSTLRWGWLARQKMSDARLLSHMAEPWDSVDALLRHLAGRPGDSFLLPFHEPAIAVERLRADYANYLALILRTADAACRNDLDVLGHDIRFDGEIDWNYESVTGWHWPLLARRRMEYYMYAGDMPADPIIIWEMNRQPHLALLGMAHWATGEARYAECAGAHIRSWIKQNPLQHGVNWYYALEVAVRLLAWTTTYQLLRQSDAFRGAGGSAFLKSVYQQAHFVRTHLQSQRSSTPNNHLMAEATALTVVGCIFPEFREAADWRETGQKVLAEQAVRQVHPDGVNKEQATCYHRFVTELLLLSVVLGRRGRLPRLPILEETVERMIGYVAGCMTPGGDAPLVGDSDYARALGLAGPGDYWDFRHLLSSGAVLFGRGEWKRLAGRFYEESYWLLGEAGLAEWERLEARTPAETSFGFPQAGVYCLRDAWTPEADFGFFRCGPFGHGGEAHCAHAHCDLLSPALWVKGRELLVDAGTYLYTTTWRDAFRLTGAHNTLMVDGHEQARPRCYFSWLGVPTAQAEEWDGQRIAGVLEAAPGVRHRRELRHVRPGLWEIEDIVSGAGHHQLSWSFHLAPDLTLHAGVIEGHILVRRGDRPFVTLDIPAGVAVEMASWWRSVDFARKEANPLLRATWQGDTSADVVFVWRFEYSGEGPQSGA